MDLISLKKNISNKDFKKNEYIEISDYSPIIKKTANIVDMLEIYKTIPNRNRCFTIVYDIAKKQLQINNYLSNDVFFEISLKKKNPFKYCFIAVSLICITFFVHYSKINKLI